MCGVARQGREVAALDAAIATAAQNPSSVSPSNQTQMQSVLNKVDELVNTLTRVT